MSERQRLPNRRRAETFAFEHCGSYYLATAGYFADGTIGEIFLNHDRTDSLVDALASDAAIAVSLALQHGCCLVEIRLAVRRDGRGGAASPIGAALDFLARGRGDGQATADAPRAPGPKPKPDIFALETVE